MVVSISFDLSISNNLPSLCFFANLLSFLFFPISFSNPLSEAHPKTMKISQPLPLFHVFQSTLSFPVGTNLSFSSFKGPSVALLKNWNKCIIKILNINHLYSDVDINKSIIEFLLKMLNEQNFSRPGEPYATSNFYKDLLLYIYSFWKGKKTINKSKHFKN